MSNTNSDIDTRPEAHELLSAIKRELPELKKLLEKISNELCYADGIYRFYHQSWKVRYLQDATQKIVTALQSLMPQREMNEWFMTIIKDGLSKDLSTTTAITQANKQWLLCVRPVVEAFLHAKYFLEMVVVSGEVLQRPPNILPSQWASTLYLYNLR